LGWPWVRITSPVAIGAAGGGGMVANPGAGVGFSGRTARDLFWLGIDTQNMSPGDYDVWVVFGSGKAILVPLQILP